ncbi:type II toxin-antitoxin system VapC family toxin [Mesorhizobium sp. CN2-181]|uniref:type II toxin-antitoxin system VapC family toxin n=1 Tax=Mesorhizobium yinganensis TaxID=3157707 RepID=UPI0032B713E2
MTYRFMLDTNTVSMAARGESARIDERLAGYGLGELCISVITEGEVLFGIAKSPGATRVARMMAAMLSRLTILSWTRETAAEYGRLRAEMRLHGRALSPLDMLIAAHALSLGSTLITSDRAFRHVPGLQVDDWNG